MQGKVYYLVLVCIVAASCDPVGWAYPLNRPRSQVMAPDYQAPVDEDSSKIVPSIPPDTVLYLCGVRMPNDYNWQRDSGIGLADGEIVLFRNMEEILHFPTGYNQGAGTDSDTHHLIDGQLYTEFSQMTKTIIMKNGETVVTFNDREYLVGLVVKSGSVYTLGMRRSGRGFCLRRDGAALMECSSGMVYGSFADSSYPQTGALYEDSGSIWFAYNIDIGGSSFTHIVKDGRDSTVANCCFDDIKVMGGKLKGVRRTMDMGLNYYDGNVSSIIGTAYTWTDCTLFSAEGALFIAGTARKRYGSDDSFLTLNLDTGDVCTYPAGDYHLYADGRQVCLAPASYEGFHYFSRSCMSFLDGTLYVGLSPYGKAGKPLLRVNGKDTELDMPGYITGVQVLLSPPS